MSHTPHQPPFATELLLAAVAQGIYHVVLRKGGDVRVLNFWAAQNSPWLSANADGFQPTIPPMKASSLKKQWLHFLAALLVFLGQAQ